jgi:hypothetical protein
VELAVFLFYFYLFIYLFLDWDQRDGWLLFVNERGRERERDMFFSLKIKGVGVCH